MHPIHRAASILVMTMAGCAAAPAGAGPLSGTKIHICDDAGEWPPYIFHRRADGQPTREIAGFSVDVITAIFNKAGIGLDIEFLPWTRCQRELAQGKPYQLALNASYNAERAQTYYLSRPYYRTTNYYFYSRKQHPAGLPIRGVADLKKYNICGLFGYNYETYGLPPGRVDQGAHDFTAVIAKVHAGRCDLFLEKYEVMAGFGVIGQPFLDDPRLGRAPVPGMARTPFYMLVSRQYAQAPALLKTINDGLADLESTGQLDRLLKKYMP